MDMWQYMGVYNRIEQGYAHCKQEVVWHHAFPIVNDRKFEPRTV